MNIKYKPTLKQQRKLFIRSLEALLYTHNNVLTWNERVYFEATILRSKE